MQNDTVHLLVTVLATTACRHPVHILVQARVGNLPVNTLSALIAAAESLGIFAAKQHQVVQCPL